MREADVAKMLRHDGRGRFGVFGAADAISGPSVWRAAALREPFQKEGGPDDDGDAGRKNVSPPGVVRHYFQTRCIRLVTASLAQTVGYRRESLGANVRQRSHGKVGCCDSRKRCSKGGLSLIS